MAQPQNSVSNAYYAADVADFLKATSEEILGVISSNTMFSVDPAQRDAWLGQIEILKPTLAGLRGAIFFEFIVPRIGSRIDVVLIIGPIIFVVEFKVGEKDINREDVNQVWDYALDLKNFHQASHEAPIVPILVATRSKHSDLTFGAAHKDAVFLPLNVMQMAFGF